jgi:hypothetical protein
VSERLPEADVREVEVDGFFGLAVDLERQGPGNFTGLPADAVVLGANEVEGLGEGAVLGAEFRKMEAMELCDRVGGFQVLRAAPGVTLGFGGATGFVAAGSVGEPVVGGTMVLPTASAGGRGLWPKQKEAQENAEEKQDR